MKHKKFLIRLHQLFTILLIVVQISTHAVHSVEYRENKNASKVQSTKSQSKSTISAATTIKFTSAPEKRIDESLEPIQILVSPNYTSVVTSTSSTSTTIKSKKKLHATSQNKSSVTIRDTLSYKASEHEPVIFIPGTRLPPIHHNYVPSIKSNKNSINYNQKSSVDWKSNGSEAWDRQYKKARYSNIKVQHIEAECQDDFMKIRVGFNGSFNGLLYSSGYAYDPDCMYINGTGRDYYEFYIQLNRCGTLGKNNHHEDNRKTPTKNYMWNTVTVQYNPLIEEEFDEHFKVTCEYGYDFWKTVSFPFLNVEVATGNPVVFTLNPPECYMEIRHGYGTAGARVANAVRVGDPLTLMIYMRSKFDGFDIAVNNCYAHNGATKKILLINEFGCPVDDTLMSKFRGSFSESGLFETQVYAYMKAFRFTGSPALYIECDVRMCHGRCPSQTCHWRNIKSVQKRSIDDNLNNSVTELNSSNSIILSDNINLFQSLRVLQDGELDDTADLSKSNAQFNNQTIVPNLTFDPFSVCIKTGWFSAILAMVVGIICLLSGALLSTCSRLKKSSKLEKTMLSIASPFDRYISHKNRFH